MLFEIKIFKHEHIIFFKEETIERMIISEYILNTFLYPMIFVKNILLIYYDSII